MPPRWLQTLQRQLYLHFCRSQSRPLDALSLRIAGLMPPDCSSVISIVSLSSAALRLTCIGQLEVCTACCLPEDRVTAQGGPGDVQALTLQVLLKRNSNSKKEGGAKDAVVAKLFIAAIEGIQSAISKANAEAGREAPLSGDAAEVAGAELKLAAEAVESFQARSQPVVSRPSRGSL